MARSKGYSADYAPFEDDYRGFEIRDDETARGPLILALAIGVLLIFGAVVWNTYRQGVRTSEYGVPSVIAEDTTFKRAPEDRGGVAVPGVEKRFYDQMDASERVLANNDNKTSDALQGGPPIELRPGRVAEDIADADPDNGMPKVVAEQVAALADLEGGNTFAAPAPSVVTEESVPAIEMPKASRYGFVTNGIYRVQVAAFRSEDAATTAWTKSKASHPALYDEAVRDIQRADLGAKGVFYRLRVGLFDDRVKASAFCDAIKDSGTNCIVVSDS